MVGATGDIVTAAGNSFAITAAGQITENGTVMSITNSVTELAYVNNTLYQEATTQNLWWSYNEAAGTWTETTNPLTATRAPPRSAGGTTGTTPSPSGTVVVGTSGAIHTAAGNSFAITAGGQISENGTVMSVTNSVTELAYVNNTLYQEATTQNLWWSYNEAAGTWTETTNPLTATTTVPSHHRGRGADHQCRQRQRQRGQGHCADDHRGAGRDQSRRRGPDRDGGQPQRRDA